MIGVRHIVGNSNLERGSSTDDDGARGEIEKDEGVKKCQDAWLAPFVWGDEEVANFTAEFDGEEFMDLLETGHFEQYMEEEADMGEGTAVGEGADMGEGVEQTTFEDDVMFVESFFDTVSRNV